MKFETKEKREIFIMNYLKDAIRFAMKHFKPRSNSRFDIDDVIQEVSVILIKAADKFNPDKGASFKTYLYRAIVNSLHNFFCNSYVIRIPFYKYMDRLKKKMSGEDIKIIDYEIVRFIDELEIADDNNDITNIIEQTEREDTISILRDNLPDREFSMLEKKITTEESYVKMGHRYKMTSQECWRIVERTKEKAKRVLEKSVMNR